MDRYRIQTWKTDQELLRYVPSAENWDAELEEFVIPVSRSVELVQAVILDIYQVTNIGIVSVIGYENCVYQVVVDNDMLTTGELVNDFINFRTDEEKWYAF